MSVLLALAAASLFGVGTYLVLQRQLSRIVIGVGLIGHGANVLFVISAHGRGTPPFVGQGDSGSFTDPLPQALMLTAIVITFGVTAFLLALAYRSWIVTSHDEVEDDVEDRLIAHRGLRPEPQEAPSPAGPEEGPDVTRTEREVEPEPAALESGGGHDPGGHDAADPTSAEAGAATGKGDPS